MDASTSNVSRTYHRLSAPIVSNGISLCGRASNITICPAPVVNVINLVRSLTRVAARTFGTTNSRVVLVNRAGTSFGNSRLRGVRLNGVRNGLVSFSLTIRGRGRTGILGTVGTNLVTDTRSLSRNNLTINLVRDIFSANLNFSIAITVSGALLFDRARSHFVLAMGPRGITTIRTVFKSTTTRVKAIATTTITGVTTTGRAVALSVGRMRAG